MPKLIVDIPEDIYECAVNMEMRCPELIIKAIKDGTPLKKWLESFNTNSASVCFNVIQDLKRSVRM